MTRRYDPRLARRHMTYTTAEICELFDVGMSTVRSWSTKGLKPVERRVPFLFAGAEVQAFIAGHNKPRQPTGPGELLPLTLLLDEITCETNANGKLNTYTFSIPFIGDDILWDLYPVAPQETLLGEVFRGNLLLEFVAQDEPSARRYVKRDLAGIKEILRQQERRIEAFHQAVPAMISAEAAKLRCESPKHSSTLH